MVRTKSSGFLDAKRPVSFPLEDKQDVNENRVVRKSHDATCTQKMSSRGTFQCTRSISETKLVTPNYFWAYF